MAEALDARIEGQDLTRTAELLGGKTVLRRSVDSWLDAHDLLEKGLPPDALDHLVKRVFLLHAKVENFEKVLGLSLRTYQRKLEGREKLLSREQSGRTWKFAEILMKAIGVFGSQEAAEKWLEEPAIGLERRKPIDLLSTPAGVEMVEDYLVRLEYGVYT